MSKVNNDLTHGELLVISIRSGAKQAIARSPAHNDFAAGRVAHTRAATSVEMLKCSEPPRQAA